MYKSQIFNSKFQNFHVRYESKVTDEQSGEQTRWISLNRCSLHNQIEFRVIPEKRDLVLLRLPKGVLSERKNRDA